MSKIKTCGIVNGCSGHWQQAAINAGYKVLWDYEPSWQRVVIEHNFKNSTILSHEQEIYAQPLPELICGSPPCNGFTPYATGTPINREHKLNNMVVRFSKIVSELKPRFFLMEEVKNFALVKNKFFAAYMRNINDNYNHISGIVNAFDYGSPQKRLRFAIGGALKPQTIHTEKFFAEKALHNFPLERLNKIFPAEIIFPVKNTPGRWNHLSTAKGRENRTLKNNKPSHTLTGGCLIDILMPGGRYLAYNEAAILMGFPSSYDFNFLPKSKRGLAIGRGIPVELAESLLQNIKKAV